MLFTGLVNTCLMLDDREELTPENESNCENEVFRCIVASVLFFSLLDPISVTPVWKWLSSSQEKDGTTA